jgi:membrane glycosyltransferase
MHAIVPPSACPAARSPAYLPRRLLFGSLVAATAAALVLLMVAAVSPGGFGVLDAAVVALFAVTLPWTVIGFWNAVIGLLLMAARDPLRLVAPFAEPREAAAPIASRVALLACIRNEDPAQLALTLGAMLDELVAAGTGGRFHLFILSDTSLEEIADAERALADELARARHGRIAVTYRRRAANDGFKAGNIRDFCERWGTGFDLAIVLDADSLMPAAAMLRLVRIMEENPQIGILQTLVSGMPSGSAFARIFQFGMRLGMRSYTLGSAWWHGDCGPYWGHNAAIRLAPFIAHCALPLLPGRPPLGGAILSHDQVEAALMRRAGYEVRVIPEEGASFEQNPPTLIEFIRRDLRWCHGNMQYWRLLRLPGLLPMSRVQLALAIQMYLGAPAWIGLLLLGMARAALPGLPPVAYDPALGPLLLWVVLAMTFAPKIATAIEILAQPVRRRSFGGGARFAAGLMAELVFSVLLAPIVALAQTLVLAGLPLRRSARWTAQLRRDHAVGLGRAARCFWPQTAFGALVAALAWRGGYAWAALPLSCGLLLAIPLAVATADPRLGRLLARLGLGCIPEETDPPAILRRVGAPALAARRPAVPDAAGAREAA